MTLAIWPAGAENAFEEGTQAYLAEDFNRAADQFRAAASVTSSAGAFHNLGNAEWKRGQAGPAILAWERAQWLDPYAANTRANLRFARRAAQLDAPALSWFEHCSTWLPVNAWALLAGASFWMAVAMLVLPGVLRWRKAEWHQALAAACFALFLLTLPALLGVHTRTKLGVALARPVPLRLTPTREAQTLGHLPAGEMVRLERERGSYLFIRAGNDAAGWVEQTQFGRVSGR